MANANIEKSKNTSIETIKLDASDRRKLKTRTTGYRKLVTTAAEIGVNKNTIYNAIAGKNLMPEVAKKITDFLNPAQVSEDQPGYMQMKGAN